MSNNYFFIKFLENYLKKYFLNELMIGELYEKLPVEIVMNILKFSRHPCAEILVEAVENYNYRDREESFISFLKENPLDEYYLYYCRCCDNFERRPFGYIGNLCQCTQSEQAEYYYDLYN